MIALDTNVLMRFLVRDDVRQTNAAASLIERVLRKGDKLFVSDIVVCETAWVLKVSYKVDRKTIAKTLADLLRASGLEFSSVDQLSRALHAFTSGKGDFADYLIREHSRAAGFNTVATFDADLLRETGFVSP